MTVTRVWLGALVPPCPAVACERGVRRGARRLSTWGTEAPKEVGEGKNLGGAKLLATVNAGALLDRFDQTLDEMEEKGMDLLVVQEHRLRGSRGERLVLRPRKGVTESSGGTMIGILPVIIW